MPQVRRFGWRVTHKLKRTASKVRYTEVYAPLHCAAGINLYQVKKLMEVFYN